MRRKKKATRKKAARKAKCHCKKAPSLANMKLTTLRTKAKQIDSAIAKKTGSLGVSKRKRAPAEFHGPVHRPHVGSHDYAD